MKAIILAAGRGQRMGALTDEQPKCLLEFRGRPLLDWQLEAIRATGVADVAMVTGYRRELLASRTPTEFHNPRWAETNMVRSLQAARAWLEAEACLVCYADLFYEAAALQGLARVEAAIAVAFDPHWLRQWSSRFADPLSDAETFRTAPDGTLLEIGGRPERIEDVQGQYMGLLRIEPGGWAEMERVIATLPSPDADRLQMTHLLHRVIEAGAIPIATAPFLGEWAEFDSPSDLMAARPT